MRTEAGAAAVSFVGDDITDEDVFAALGAGDLGVRVGAGTTSARRRLRDPAVLTSCSTLSRRRGSSPRHLWRAGDSVRTRSGQATSGGCDFGSLATTRS